MLSKLFTYLKFALVPLIGWFFYWAVIWEMGILQKPIQEALASAPSNWIALFILVFAEFALLLKTEKHKVEFEAFRAKQAASNPFFKPQKSKLEVPHVFGKKSMLDTFANLELYKRVFLKIKRVVYGLLVVLYVAMALTSIGNLLFFFVFVITAYAFLENLLWYRKYSWVKKKKEKTAEYGT